MSLENLTRGERFIVDWQYRIMGGFSAALINALIKADDFNKQRLFAGFPDEVQAYRNFTEIEGWWDKVQVKAGLKQGDV